MYAETDQKTYFYIFNPQKILQENKHLLEGLLGCTGFVDYSEAD